MELEQDNSLVNKKFIDSKTTNPTGNEKDGNLPSINGPITSVINPQARPRPSIYEDLQLQVERRFNYMPPSSKPSSSFFFFDYCQNEKVKIIQDKLARITFNSEVNEGHGVPFGQQYCQDLPLDLLCRGLSS